MNEEIEGQEQAGALKKEMSSAQKFVMVAVVAVAAFYFAYSYGQSSSQQGGYAYAGGSGTGSTGYATGTGSGGGGGGGCCGGGGGGAQVTKETTVQDGKQVVDMVVNNGWNPNTIKAKADLPTTINLDVQQAGGCVSALVFQSLNTGVQLQSGSKQTLELPALKAGTYQFSCQMGMINGSLVVE